MKLLERLTRRDDRLSFSLLAAGFGGTGIAVLAAVCASLPGLQWDRPFGPLAMIGLVDLSSGIFFAGALFGMRRERLSAHEDPQ